MITAGRPFRSRAALTLALLGSAAVAGCGKEPGGQVVAVVNDEEITRTELRAQAAAENTPANIDFQTLAPQLLDRVIQRNLLADYARDEGLNRGPDYLARRRQLEQTLLASLALQKLLGKPPVPTEAEVTKYIADNPTMFASRERLILDQLRFPAPADMSIVKDAAAQPTIDAILARLRAKGVAVERSPATLPQI